MREEFQVLISANKTMPRNVFANRTTTGKRLNLLKSLSSLLIESNKNSSLHALKHADAVVQGNYGNFHRFRN